VASLEFAAVLPVLVVILAGTADYCRFSSTAVAVANAARCGAGYGCMHPYDIYTEESFMTQCRQVVIDEISGSTGFDVNQLQVTILKLGTAPDDRIEVTASYPFKTVINWAFLPRNSTITRTAVLPIIR
jgi:Flp pilus assembly protein TadG